ncbi:MAG: ATP-grasp domain-containing protein [Proteobacteria bacterium]|nr:ATP-grasp domain-containing protein [Pseudomonadota bacterium]
MAHVISPISRLLVANRGEIARRINRTAQAMGISTVAIYADGDVNAPFVLEADTAIALNGKSTGETYLDVAKVLDAAQRSGADAIHPGYGFLSENQAFAQAVIDAGVKWLGPSPEVIGLMGDKLSAKRLMDEAGVPTLPGVEITQDTDIVAAAADIGYPVLVKASAGGGGRGMRVVEAAAELLAAVQSAKREAGSSFGDDTVFLEKWLATSRHIEIQILGDNHGNLVHCYERECSIQRRHQKIIEEAPSPAVDDALRSRMGDAAIAAARKLGYASAGTVEFLLGDNNDFYFLEVNARLQVEHPVTEEIIGKDLVREQIRVAEGETLSFRQEDISINGHAIEARLYAENPAKGFLPSPGPILVWQPATAGGARFDSGVEAGSEISTQFDPMIAKVIVHAPTRREAAGRLARVLETTAIAGLNTNRDFLVTTLRTPEYLAGDTTTDFIERVQPALQRHVTALECIQTAVAVTMEAQAARRAAAKVLKTLPSGFRNSTMPMQTATYAVNGNDITVAYQSQRDGSFKVVCDEQTHAVTIHRAGNGSVDIALDGQRLQFEIQQHGMQWLVHGDTGDLVLTQAPRYPDPQGLENSGGLTAPMPGAVLTTEVTAGDEVSKGDLLVILEAMKMEHRIVAPRDGVVEAVHVGVGDQVDNAQLLVTLAEEQ